MHPVQRADALGTHLVVLGDVFQADDHGVTSRVIAKDRKPEPARLLQRERGAGWSSRRLRTRLRRRTRRAALTYHEQAVMNRFADLVRADDDMVTLLYSSLADRVFVVT